MKQDPFFLRYIYLFLSSLLSVGWDWYANLLLKDISVTLEKYIYVIYEIHIISGILHALLYWHKPTYTVV